MHGYVALGALLFVPACALAAQPALEVPFEFLHNQIVLSSKINGAGPFNAILDTGTHASSIDVRLAKRLALPLGKSGIRGVGAGTGKVSGRLASIDELRIGELSVRALPAVAIDLSQISRQLGRPLHVVLGFSFFNQRTIQIDYFHRRVRFFEGASFHQRVPPDSRRLVSFPMRFRDGSILPVLEDCHVNGMRVSVALDTGSSLGLILFPQAIRYLGAEKLASEGIPLQAVGYLGAARLRKGWVRSLALKTIDLGAIEVAYVEKGYGEDEDLARRGGNLGNAILQDFTVTLDYRNRVVVLESAEE